MTFIEVVDVAAAKPDARLLGSSIDLPQPGSRLEGSRFDVAGWALGRGGKPVRLECVVNGRLAARPSRATRVDLADAFPDIRRADRGGFLAEVEMPATGTAEVELRAVVARARVTLGRVSVRRRWRASSDPTLRTLVSIVIAAGDRPDLLSAAMDSALSQSYSNVEIVVVGDESIGEEDPSRYGSVRWVRADAPGTASAWDAGTRETNGDYLVFLDVGETLPANALAEAVRALEADPAAGRFAGIYRRALVHAIGPFASDRSRHASADRPGPNPSPSVEHRSELSPSPLVSVVIPCYQQAHFLSEAIESVIDQSSVDAEIIVVDDGSLDNTAGVARRYPAVRYIRQPNRGLARARNRGLDDALGEFVVFLDADDRLLPDALATAIRAFDEHPESVLVFGDTIISAEDGSPDPPPHRSRLGEDPYRHLLVGCPIIGPGTVMYRRSLFGSIPAFDPSISPAADYDLYYRVARAYPILCHGAVVAVYRRHGGNMTSGSRTMLRANVTAIRRQRRYLIRRPRYWRAYRRGVRYWQAHQGNQVAQQVQRDLHQRRFGEALRGLGALLVWSPRTMLALLRSPRTLIPIREWKPEG